LSGETWGEVKGKYPYRKRAVWFIQFIFVVFLQFRDFGSNLHPSSFLSKRISFDPLEEREMANGAVFSFGVANEVDAKLTTSMIS
jgi:hypothetical protein